MGEKSTKIVFGAVVEDMPPCPHEDGSWSQWFWEQAERKLHGRCQIIPVGDYGVGFLTTSGKCRLLTSYESDPRWVGFSVDVLSYGGVCLLDPELEAYRTAQKAWGLLKQYFHAEGMTLPDGHLLIAHDE